MANEFEQPSPYSPDNVIGDTLDEIKPAFNGGGQHLPAEAYTFFTGGGTHTPAAAIDIVGDKTSYNPTLIIGDALNEVRPIATTDIPYNPSRIIGDQPNEIQQAPKIELMPPAANGPQSTPNVQNYIPAAGLQSTPSAIRHVPAEPIIISLPTQISTPPAPAGPPPQTFEKYTPVQLTMNEISNKMRYSDNVLSSALRQVGLDSFGFPGGAGSQNMDPELFAKNSLALGKSIGTTGILNFIGTQTILHALNAKYAKIFDPKYFVNRLPFLNSYIRMTLDGETHEEFVAAFEAIRQHDVMLTAGDTDELNMFSSKVNYAENVITSIGGLVNAALKDGNDNGMSQFLDGEKIKAGAFFEVDSKKIGNQNPKTELNARTERKSIETYDGLKNSAFSSKQNSNIPAGFKRDRNDSSIKTTGDALPSSIIDDDDAYVPLSFTDLRPIDQKGQYRSVYFRPIITSFSENFSPSWSEESAFGRVDPIAVYQNTKRTISLGFELHAMSPSDLKIIYQKLHWLQSFVYPEYDKDFLYKSGPVIRMRIGDVISSAGHGLGGFISSLSFDYTDSLWELKRTSKAPRSISVSLDFTALHDGPVGVRDGRFGVLALPSKDNAEQENETKEHMTNKFRGFGEPFKYDDE